VIIINACLLTNDNKDKYNCLGLTEIQSIPNNYTVGYDNPYLKLKCYEPKAYIVPPAIDQPTVRAARGENARSVWAGCEAAYTTCGYSTKAHEG
jgi:hypothetical protein